MLTNNNTSVIYLDFIDNSSVPLRNIAEQPPRFSITTERRILVRTLNIFVHRSFPYLVGISGTILLLLFFSVISYILPDMLVNFSRIQSTPAPTHIVYNTCDPFFRYGNPILYFHLAVQTY